MGSQKGRWGALGGQSALHSGWVPSRITTYNLHGTVVDDVQADGGRKGQNETWVEMSKLD